MNTKLLKPLILKLKPLQAIAASAMLILSGISFAQNIPNTAALTTNNGLCCDTTATGVCVQPMPGRPSSSRVSEPARFSDLYKRMDKLDTGNCAHAYYLHKTQAWLNISRDFYHEGDGSNAVNLAYDEAEKLIKALENGLKPSADTVLIQDAVKLRPDLWQIAADRKSTPALLSSAAREIAYCEVYLVRAGHALANLGGKARVEPLISMAQDVCQAAKDKTQCPTLAPVAVPVPAPVPVAAPVIAPVITPVIVTPAPTPAPASASSLPAPKRPVKQDRN